MVERTDTYSQDDLFSGQAGLDGSGMSLDRFRRAVQHCGERELVANSGEYAAPFRAWILSNWDVAAAVFKVADRWRARSEHWSIGAAIYVVRFEIGTKQNPHRYDVTNPKTGEPFKVDNNHAAGLARLYNAITGSSLFELRKRGGRGNGIDV